MHETFEAIYRANRQGLYTLALSITGRPDRAEDAVQEGFARLFRLKATPTGDPIAYAFAAIRNAAIDQRRRNKPMESLTPGEAIYDGRAISRYEPVQQILDAEQVDLVRLAISELSDEQRQAIVMKVYAGLTFEQIAEAMDLPLGTIASRYRRGLEKLREKLEKFSLLES